MNGKISQQQANYRRGFPMHQCGTCVMYTHGAKGLRFGGCTKVSGQITTYGQCDLYAELGNPFGSVLGPYNGPVRQMLNEWFQQQVAQSGQPG
jgi:hypothetical protein